jgi:hypothetical protein
MLNNLLVFLYTVKSLENIEFTFLGTEIIEK